jgi:putative nucleotidyltransferase-like protein
MDSSHFGATLALGRVGAREAEVASVVRRLGSGALHGPALLDTLSRSKVTRLARAALAEAKLNAPARTLRDRIDEAEQAEDGWRRRAVPPMRAALSRAAHDGGRVIKGLAVQPLYPDPDLRHLGDVDLQFPSWGEALPTLRWLREQGWVYDTSEYSWLKWHPSSVPYGQLSLVLADNQAPYARVDLHLGPYSVGHAGLMPLAGWRAGEPLGVPAPVSGAETSIAIVAAHAICDRMLSVKDVNDLHVLAGAGGVDWASVAELCRAVQAGPALAQYAGWLARAYPGDVAPVAPAAPVLGYAPPDPGRRARAFAALAYRDERARGAGRAAAARLAASARRYFAADLSPRPSRRPDTGPVARQRRRDTCWRLLPRETWQGLPAGEPPGRAPRREQLATDLVLVRAGAGAAVVCGTDVFVPTVWGGVNPASVALARRLDADHDGGP